MKLNYRDVTREWLKNSCPNSHRVKTRNYYEHDGIRYFVDGKKVVLDYDIREKTVALWIENVLGGELYLLPRINEPIGIMTADYLFRDEYWDLKNVIGDGKRVIEDLIKKKKRQSLNFIIDITDSKISDIDLMRQINKLFVSKTTNWVEKIIVKDKEKIIIICEKIKND